MSTVRTGTIHFDVGSTERKQHAIYALFQQSFICQIRLTDADIGLIDTLLELACLSAVEQHHTAT